MSFIPLIIFLLCPGRISDAARKGLETCIVSVIPSLFPFMAASKLAVLSGDLDENNRFFRFISRLFKISPPGVWSFISGLICGYPTGAKSVCDLLRERRITEKEAAKLLCFCNNGGPAFIISVAGGAFLGSCRYGIIIYLCHIISAIITGISLRFIPSSPTVCIPAKRKPLTEALPEALGDAAMGIVNISGIIIFFSAFLEGLRFILPADFFADSLFEGFFCGIFEITTGIKIIAFSEAPLFFKLPLIAFLTSFSGFSVLIQSFSFAKGLKIKKAPCILCKTLSACLSALICYFLTIAILFLERAS